jgi:hypothetical protein
MPLAAAYRARVSTGAPHRRTLWEEGNKPGPLVAVAAGVVVLLVAGVDLLLFNDVTLLTDVAFVAVCVAAVLLVHPRDFFVVGVCPPLIMAGAFAVLSVLAPGALAEPSDGFLQAVVSGLAHHAGALVVGYGLTLGLLALRQMALRNAGAIRAAAKRSRIEV